MSLALALGLIMGALILGGCVGLLTGAACAMAAQNQKKPRGQYLDSELWRRS